MNTQRYKHYSHSLLFVSLNTMGCFFSQSAFAENQVHQLEKIVFTATRSEKKQLDSPIWTEIISPEELKRTNALTLKDALENIPGILLKKIHGKSGYEISMQGMTGDQVLVLIDGLPLAASTNSTVDLSQYLVSGIAQIEVIKGAASAQYGSSAIGGVINILTSQPKEGLSVSGQIDVGSYGKQNNNGRQLSMNNHHEKLQIDASNKELKGRIIVDQLKNDGFSPNPEQYARQGDEQNRQQFSTYLVWNPSADFNIWGDYSNYDEKDHQRELVFISPREVQQFKTEDIQRKRLSAGSKFNIFEKYQVDLKGVHETYDTRSVQTTDSFLSALRNSNQENNHFSSQLNLPNWYRQNWQLGYDWHEEKLQQSNNGKFEMQGGKVSRDRHEFFVQNDIKVTDKLDTVLGWRFQNDQDFGNHHALKISSKYRIFENAEQLADVRFSYGQGYRVPNLKERFYSFDHSHLGYVVIGNPNLKPESSDSFQLGFNFVRHDDFHADINFFLNDVKNLIQTDFDQAITVNGITQYTYSNVAKTQAKGIETTAQWMISPDLTLNAAYTYTDTKDKLTQLNLTNRPKHVARLGTDYSINDRFDLSIRTRYQSQEYVDSKNLVQSPDWFTADTQLDYKIHPQLSAFVGIDNIFNHQRDFNSVADFRPAEGRHSYVGLRFNWTK